LYYSCKALGNCDTLRSQSVYYSKVLSLASGLVEVLGVYHNWCIASHIALSVCWRCALL